MKDFAVLTQNLSYHFGDIRAVDDLCLEIPEGVVFGFLGPNGSGKTTTIRLLLGLLEPKAGGAQVLSFDVRKQSHEIRARAGALLEHNGLYERMSAEENLEFFGHIYRMSQRECKLRIKELLSHFDLWDRRHEMIGTWSRGMKQKVAIARAMLHRPSIIFLDEPTAGLDPVAASSLRHDIAKLVEQNGVTVFLNTHNLPEAEKLCAQVGVIRTGKLLSVGSLDQLRAAQGTSCFVITGCGFTAAILDQLQKQPMVVSAALQTDRLVVNLRNKTDVSQLVRFLVMANVQVEEVHNDKATLEDMFLKLMEEEANDN